MKKRIISILLVVILIMGMVSGCKKNAGTPEDNAIVENVEEEEEEKGYVFGYSCIDKSNPYFDTLQMAIETELKERNATLSVKNPALNIDTQIEQINEFIAEGVDGVFLCPVDWEGIEPAIMALKEADIPIINIDTEVKDIDFVDAYVGSDNKNAGFVCGENLIKKLPEGGKVVILESPSMNSINDRITGFEEAISNGGFEVVARADVKGDLQTAMDEMERILREQSEIDAVMCGNDQSALGALVSVNVAKRDGILVYGVDGSPDLKKELMKSGTQIAGTGAQSPINIGKSAVEVAFAILEQENYDKFTYEPTFFIDKDNVELYGTDGWQ